MPAFKTAKRVASPVVGTEPVKKTLRDVQQSIGNMRSQEYSGTKTSGIKTRGNGAAQRGVTARGPMA